MKITKAVSAILMLIQVFVASGQDIVQKDSVLIFKNLNGNKAIEIVKGDFVNVVFKPMKRHVTGAVLDFTDSTFKLTYEITVDHEVYTIHELVLLKNVSEITEDGGRWFEIGCGTSGQGIAAQTGFSGDIGRDFYWTFQFNYTRTLFHAEGGFSTESASFQFMKIKKFKKAALSFSAGPSFSYINKHETYTYVSGSFQMPDFEFPDLQYSTPIHSVGHKINATTAWGLQLDTKVYLPMSEKSGISLGAFLNLNPVYTFGGFTISVFMGKSFIRKLVKE